MVLPTSPYYRSTYVFVTRREHGVNVHSFDDPILRRVRVGVQLIGDDGTNSPPAHALSNRGIINNVKGYTVYGDYSKDSPPSRIIDAVASGDAVVPLPRVVEDGLTSSHRTHDATGDLLAFVRRPLLFV